MDSVKIRHSMKSLRMGPIVVWILGILSMYGCKRLHEGPPHHEPVRVLKLSQHKGYSITWPRGEGGLTPWQDGKGDLVKMQEYVPGGLISAAPGPSNWFHQHFAVGKDSFRVFNYTGAMPGNPESGASRENDLAQEGDLIRQHADITEGGNAIPYHLEDPHVRREFEAKLKEEGAVSTMPPEVYSPTGAGIEVMTD